MVSLTERDQLIQNEAEEDLVRCAGANPSNVCFEVVPMIEHLSRSHRR
jgi:hypothetical protein